MPSTLTVTNNLDSGAGSLRDTIAASRSGDLINFDPSLNGQTIILTSGELAISWSLDIEGPGGKQPPVTISGNEASRVFDITNSSALVTLANLDIVNGLAGEGGGLLNQGGAVSLSHCNVTFNQAQGDATSSGDAMAGGLASVGGTLTLNQCVVDDNEAVGPFSTSGHGQGGGIDIVNGTLTVADGEVAGNEAIGGIVPSGQSGDGEGGGIYAADSSLTIKHCQFTGDDATGGGACIGVNGDGLGGAMFLLDSDLALKATTFSGDLASTAGNNVFVAP